MTWDVRDVTHRKRGLRFAKSQLVEFCRRKKKIDFRLLAEALWRVRTWFGADGKVSIERWYLSPYVEEPFNPKVIKSFVPELRSRKCFRVSGFLCYPYMCVMDIMNVLRTGLNMSISRVHIWLCNIIIIVLLLASFHTTVSWWLSLKCEWQPVYSSC